MKKFFRLLCVLVIVSTLMFVGCSKSNDCVEVQSITYYISPSHSQEIRWYDEEHPLKIRFLENNCLEISYWERYDNGQWQYEKKSIKIYPISYQINYYID